MDISPVFVIPANPALSGTESSVFKYFWTPSRSERIAGYLRESANGT
jgi:hypothetical protein